MRSPIFAVAMLSAASNAAIRDFTSGKVLDFWAKDITHDYEED